MAEEASILAQVEDGCTPPITPSSVAVEGVFSLLNALTTCDKTARLFAGGPASTSPDAAVQ